MELIEWAWVACGVVGAAGILWYEWVLYRERMWEANEPWWSEGSHDEVRTWR